MLEFRAIAKRILGDDAGVTETDRQNGMQSNTTLSANKKLKTDSNQLDLFGSPAADSVASEIESAAESSTANFLSPDKNINNTLHNYLLLNSTAAILQFIESIKNEPAICFDTETTGLDPNEAELVGLSFSIKPTEGFYIPCPADKTECIELLNNFQPLFNNSNICWIGQNIKYDLLMLKWYGFELKGEIFDTMLAHYVIEPDGKSSMDVLSAKYLGYQPVSITELIGKKGKGQGNMRDIELEKIKEYAAEDADITLQLKNVFLPIIKKEAVEKVLYEVEIPLVKVLTDMEFEGIRIDENFLKDYSTVLQKDAKEFEESVYEQAGIRFNLASPKQLGEVLFDKMQLDPKAKKTKTGQYATGEDVLAKLAHQHKICNDILSFRELTKLKNTYVDALPELINSKTGRVHTSYAQAVAVTGRLSSTNPNLQNIPVRTERGKEIRKAFIPRDENHVLVSADYSQI